MFAYKRTTEGHRNQFFFGYCIEPGTPLNIGDVMTKRDENYWDNYPSAYNKTISADEIKLFIGRIFQYGYTGKVDIDWRSQNSADADKMAHIMATQTLIWETVVGERDSNFNHVDTGSYRHLSRKRGNGKRIAPSEYGSVLR